MALLVLAFAGLNVRVDSGTNDTVFGAKRFAPHAVQLFDGGGKLSFHMDTLRVAARSMLVDVPSCRRRAVSGSRRSPVVRASRRSRGAHPKDGASGPRHSCAATEARRSSLATGCMRGGRRQPIGRVHTHLFGEGLCQGGHRFRHSVSGSKFQPGGRLPFVFVAA